LTEKQRSQLFNKSPHCKILQIKKDIKTIPGRRRLHRGSPPFISEAALPRQVTGNH